MKVSRVVRWGAVPVAALGFAFAVAGPIRADDEGEDGLLGADPIDARSWSATILGQINGVESDQDDDHVSGFFDRYRYTPNKDPGIGLEIGLRDLSFDWVEDRETRLQIRFDSPSSNLGITGSDIDEPFWNQRGLLLGRTDAFRLDAKYRRMRTEQLRLFPETDAGGGALPFTDLTRRSDRFFRDRTGFGGEIRWRPDVSFVDEARESGTRSRFLPEMSLRAGTERRETKRQIRTLLNPGNDWLAVTDTRGDDVHDVGVGFLVVPIAGITITADYDYQEFETDNANLDDALPFASTSRSVAFVPSTERHTGRIQAHKRVKDRATISAGFQVTRLDQKSPETPAQRSTGFGDNETLAYTAQLSGDLRVTDSISASAAVKYAYRDHDLDRSGPLFSPTNGTQVDEFLKTYKRIDAEAEVRYRASRRARFAAGIEMLWIDRELDFAESGLANPVIQPATALVNDETQMWTLFGQADLRPLPLLSVRAKLSYRIAPDTGYVTDLDNYFEGEIRGNYTLPISRPASLGLFVRGGIGENSDFKLVGGLAPNPPGPAVDRDYERSHVTFGMTGDWAWRDDATLFGSLFYSHDDQSDDLLLSNLQRYFQEVIPITFRSVGSLDFGSDEVDLVTGVKFLVSERTDGSLSYGYTWTETSYDHGSDVAIQLIDANRRVEADIHSVELGIRHKLREGIRLFAGYRIQYFRDGVTRPSSLGSVRQPPDRSDLRHTVTVGVTLNGDLLDRR
jgi:hypothetical protein